MAEKDNLVSLTDRPKKVKRKSFFVRTKRRIEIEYTQAQIKIEMREIKINRGLEYNRIQNNQKWDADFKAKITENLFKSTDKRLEILQKRWDELQEEQLKLNDPLPPEDKEEIKIVEDNKKEEIKEEAKEKKNYWKRIKAATKSATASLEIVSTLSFIVSIALEYISLNNSKLDDIVVEVNNDIVKAKTKAEIDTVKIKRNNALIIIGANERKLEDIKKYAGILTLITGILNPLIELLSFLPPLAITGFTIRQISKLEKILSKVVIFLPILLLVITKLEENIAEIKAKLQNISDILDSNIENLSANEIQDLLRTSDLGYLNGYDYKDFKFFIKEEDNKNFVVKGNKRRYAVAVNKDGNEILQTKSSFTLNPPVLVEELKLQIDQKGLVA
jgi:hypothetical protein